MFIYFTVHYEKQGSDLDKYPQVFKDNIYIACYGVDGITDHVDSDVYDYHRSYEIDKTQMKILVPLSLNGNKLTNVSLDRNDDNSEATVKMVKDVKSLISTNLYNEIFDQVFDIVMSLIRTDYVSEWRKVRMLKVYWPLVKNTTTPPH